MLSHRCKLKGILLSIVILTIKATPNLDPSLLNNIIEQLQQGENVIFTKFGDGEYNCMNGFKGRNCDNDNYHPWLAQKLKHAFIGLIEKNAYIGQWPIQNVIEYYTALARSRTRKPIQWTYYQLILNYDKNSTYKAFFEYPYLYNFTKYIIKTNRKKIVVCNSNNKKLKGFFKAQVLVEIPSRNWSYKYSIWKEKIDKHIEKNSIVIIAGGMCSKILINDLASKHNASFIDVGSAFDILAGKHNSRGWQHTYQQEISYFQNLLPHDWDS